MKRETRRHERATVLQQLGAQADDPRAWQRQRALEVSRMKRANRGGGGHRGLMGVVTTPQGAGGARSPEVCAYCNDEDGGCWYCGRG